VSETVAEPRTQEELTLYHRNHPFTLPQPGDMIISPLTGTRYTIGAHFGHGSFGEVFLCTDEWGHDLVAKIIRPEGDVTATEESASREIAALALVRSPHIVHVHDAILFRGACYIISEECDLTLREFLASPTLNPSLWFRPFVRHLLHALHFVHLQGLVHCDIHSGNVFLHFIPDAIAPENLSASVFKLGDFGLARPIESMDPSGTFLASLRPPEAINPEFGPLDHRSDLYQAGLLFLTFLNKEELSLTPSEILDGRPRELAEAFPHPAAPVIAKMLRRHSSMRHGSALEAWRDMDALLDIH
jgi:serine/threonine protein kinase